MTQYVYLFQVQLYANQTKACPSKVKTIIVPRVLYQVGRCPIVSLYLHFSNMTFPGLSRDEEITIRHS